MPVRTSRVLAGVLVAFTATGCAVNAAGHTDLEQRAIDENVEQAIDHASFFHPDCVRSDIQVKRVSQNGRLLELSICGTIRRYQNVSPASGRALYGPTWVDVTTATAS